MSQFLITATWDDAPHLSEAVKAELLAAIPSNQRDARTKGIPYLGIGQYFPQFSEERHVISKKEAQERIKPWHKHWLSGDWGYEHPFCIHKHAMDEHNRVTTYAEMWGKNKGETELGREIGAWCAGQKFLAFVFSWDAGKLSKRSQPKFPKSIAQMIGEALPKGFPQPAPADSSPGSRIAGARLMSNLMDTGMWSISSDCQYLIDCLPSLIKDPDNPEDVLKVDHTEDQLGDDPYDAARMGLQYMLGSVKPPVAERVLAKLDAQKVTDIHSRIMMFNKLASEEKKKGQPVKFFRKPKGSLWRN